MPIRATLYIAKVKVQTRTYIFKTEARAEALETISRRLEVSALALPSALVTKILDVMHHSNGLRSAKGLRFLP